MNDFWNRVYFGNTASNWMIALTIIAGGFVILHIARFILLRRLKKWSIVTNSTLDDFLVSILEKSIVPFLYFACVYGGVLWLSLPQKIIEPIRIAMLLVTTFYTLKIVSAALQYFILGFIGKQDDGEAKQKQAGGILVIVKVVIWVLGSIFLLDNLGYNITTIIAGLGIGGIAIALAAQAILGDLFSYFVILFDRPFEIGDFIIVDDKTGVVEYVGIKTTRLRNLGGEQLICSNKDLTDSRIHNYKRMERRRVVFKLGVTYQTTPEILESIPEIVKEIVVQKEDVLYDRGHFSGLGDFSLNFEFVYYILSSDYLLYMNRQQEIYYRIYREFTQKGIDFAYPTQTLHVVGESSFT